jgi:asparagine synthase (glutamine-hydrolysing)
MCRLTGIISPSGNAPALLRMREAMRHGGPDDAGTYADPEKGVWLGHRRLAILDLSEAGHQPMQDESGEIVLIYNGELYNFREIRQQLEASGHVFRTQTDTEVVLKAYKAWGAGCLRRFNGIFALALYDRRSNTVLLARDHAGIKPLYYSRQGRELIFASEIRAFRALRPDWPTHPEWKTHLLSFGFIPEPLTVLAQVQMLPAGHMLEWTVSTGKSRLAAWEQTPPASAGVRTLPEARALVRDALQESVRRQMISDAPIGLFLSGGVDSSVLTLAAAAVSREQVHTVGLRFEEQAYDESHYQNLIVSATGVRHDHFQIRQQDFAGHVEDILLAMDQPCNDGVNTYFIARYARQAGLKAALSGIGADECFGGYPSFQRAGWLQDLRRLPRTAFRSAEHLRSDRLRKTAFLALDGPTGDYLFLRGLFTPRQVARLSGQSESAVWEQLRNLPVAAGLSPGKGPLYISRLEQAYYQQNQLLRDADVMGMWHGLEIRVPYLDRRFLEQVETIDPALRFTPGQPKQLLIDAFSPELPRAIWDRPKRGFTFPFARWFRDFEPLRSQAALAHLYRQFAAGQLHWSRLWTAYLSMQYR